MGPLHVHLADLERLCPEGLGPDDLRAWLRAPIAGEPLLKRLLQPLVGLPVDRITARPSRAAEALDACLPLFGFHLDLEDGLEDAHVVLPAQGLLEVDLATLLQRAERAEVQLRADAVDACGARVGRLRVRLGKRGPSTCAQALSSLRLWTTGTAFELLSTSRRALEGDVKNLTPGGRWIDALLTAPHARCRGEIVPPGPASLGEDSIVEAGALLEPGAIVGDACFVGRSARVGNALILDGSTVHAGAELRDVVRLPSGLDLPATSGLEALTDSPRRNA